MYLDIKCGDGMIKTRVKCDRYQCVNNENGVCSSPDIKIVWFSHAEHPSCITEQCRGVQ